MQRWESTTHVVFRAQYSELRRTGRWNAAYLEEEFESINQGKSRLARAEWEFISYIVRSALLWMGRPMEQPVETEVIGRNDVELR